MFKICTNPKCFYLGIKQEMSKFSIRSKKDFKYESWCKDCKSKYKKQWKKDNREILSTKNKKYREINSDKIKEWIINNKELISIKNKILYIHNKDDILLKQKEYRNLNKKKLSLYNKEYRKNRRKIDLTFRLRTNVSRTINNSLLKNNSSKNKNSCLKYLNYTFLDLKEYLDKQFEPWMNWDNYGAYSAKTWNDEDKRCFSWRVNMVAFLSASSCCYWDLSSS